MHSGSSLYRHILESYQVLLYQDQAIRSQSKADENSMDFRQALTALYQTENEECNKANWLVSLIRWIWCMHYQSHKVNLAGYLWVPSDESRAWLKSAMRWFRCMVWIKYFLPSEDLEGLVSLLCPWLRGIRDGRSCDPSARVLAEVGREREVPGGTPGCL